MLHSENTAYFYIYHPVPSNISDSIEDQLTADVIGQLQQFCYSWGEGGGGVRANFFPTPRKIWRGYRNMESNAPPPPPPPPPPPSPVQYCWSLTKHGSMQ